MTQNHKHADVLIAIAEGRDIQCKPQGVKNWIIAINVSEVNPLTHPEYEWRIKSEPKPDVEVYVVWDNYASGACIAKERHLQEECWKHAIKLTFDAETNEYKSTEVIKS